MTTMPRQRYRIVKEINHLTKLMMLYIKWQQMDIHTALAIHSSSGFTVAALSSTHSWHRPKLPPLTSSHLTNSSCSFTLPCTR
jgi:hypothetical protein